MLVPEYLSKVSHRWHRIYLRLLEEEMQEPSRSDYYLMQIACEVRRVLSKKPSSIKLKDFLLKFSDGRAKSNMTREQAAAHAKAKWFAALGVLPPTEDGEMKFRRDKRDRREPSGASTRMQRPVPSDKLREKASPS